MWRLPTSCALAKKTDSSRTSNGGAALHYNADTPKLRQVALLPSSSKTKSSHQIIPPHPPPQQHRGALSNPHPPPPPSLAFGQACPYCHAPYLPPLSYGILEECLKLHKRGLCDNGNNTLVTVKCLQCFALGMGSHVSTGTSFTAEHLDGVLLQKATDNLTGPVGALLAVGGVNMGWGGVASQDQGTPPPPGEHTTHNRPLSPWYHQSNKMEPKQKPLVQLTFCLPKANVNFSRTCTSSRHYIEHNHAQAMKQGYPPKEHLCDTHSEEITVHPFSQTSLKVWGPPSPPAPPPSFSVFQAQSKAAYVHSMCISILACVSMEAPSCLLQCCRVMSWVVT